jgi:hypothetical protein
VFRVTTGSGAVTHRSGDDLRERDVTGWLKSTRDELIFAVARENSDREACRRLVLAAGVGMSIAVINGVGITETDQGVATASWTATPSTSGSTVP